MVKSIYKLLLLFICLSGQTLLAQDYADTSIVNEAVTILGNRLDVPFKKESRAIEVISKKEIELLPVQNIPELLQYYSGMDIRRRGINGVQADAGIRGGSFDQTLVLVNGVKMNDQQTGHHAMNLPIAIQDIERIEIIKGPAAMLYGQNALAGVINIITKKPDTLSLKADVSFGTWNTNNQNVTISAPINNYKQSLSLSRSVSDGYRYNTDYNIRSANYQSSAKINKYNEVSFFAGYTERKFGANGFYASEDFKDQYEEVQTSLGALQSKHIIGNAVLNTKMHWRRNQDIYLFLRNDPAFYRNRHIGNRVGAEANVSYPLGKNGVLGAGAELAKEYLRSNNLGDFDRDISSFYLDYRWNVTDRFFIHPGLFINKWSDTDTRFFPGIDMAYNFTNDLNLYAAYNLSNRIPTYTDLYYTSPSEQGNANLLSETLQSFELGLKYETNGIRAKIARYYNQGSNLIDWAKDSLDQAKWLAQNFKDITTTGLELGISLNVHEYLQMPANLTLSYQGSIIDSRSTDEIDEKVSRYTLDHLGNQHIFGLTAGFVDNRLTLSLLGRSVRRDAFATTDELFDYSLMDAKLSFRFKNFTIYANGNNLLDEAYKETTLVLMPGRNFLIGLKAHIL